MIPRRWRLVGLLALSAIQIAVPASMIVQHERTLRSGELFKFRTEPVDPYDAFRGKYVRIRVAEPNVPLPERASRRNARAFYAILGRGEDGFAKVLGLTDSPPGDGSWLEVELGNRGDGDLGTVVFPFDRFYMDEDLAPRAEEAYSRSNRRGAENAYVTVRVLSGRGVIEDLFIEGRPIRDHLLDPARHD